MTFPGHTAAKPFFSSTEILFPATTPLRREHWPQSSCGEAAGAEAGGRRRQEPLSTCRAPVPNGIPECRGARLQPRGRTELALLLTCSGIWSKSPGLSFPICDVSGRWTLQTVGICSIWTRRGCRVGRGAGRRGQERCGGPFCTDGAEARGGGHWVFPGPASFPPVAARLPSPLCQPGTLPPFYLPLQQRKTA